MPTASRPSAVAAKQVANAIEDTVPACLHDDFMFLVNELLEKRGLSMQAHQQGIRGTLIKIVRVS